MQINYRGDLCAPSGYGRAARAHMRALITAGVSVRGEISQHDKTQLEFEEESFWKEHMPKVLGAQKTCHVRVWHETPEFFVPDPTQYNIAYTVWETSKIVDFPINGSERNNWVGQLNRMDEVWTSSEFCKKAFEDSGVTVPVHVFPHPVDLEVYSPAPSEGQFYLDGKPVDKMVFLSVFQFTKRKNPHDLLLAWTAEFATQEDVHLVIKTYGAAFDDNTTIEQYVAGMRQSSRIQGLKQNVSLILDKLEDDELPGLYRMCDAFVLPSYGEGFGMPYQEAMACGKPVIYTDASAMPEFCVGYPIACDPEPVSGMMNIPWYNADQDWWKVKVADLRKQLRHAYDDWKSGKILDLGKEARSKVCELHAFEVVGKSMRQRLEEITWRIKDGSSRPELVALWGPQL